MGRAAARTPRLIDITCLQVAGWPSLAEAGVYQRLPPGPVTQVLNLDESRAAARHAASSCGWLGGSRRPDCGFPQCQMCRGYVQNPDIPQ